MIKALQETVKKSGLSADQVAEQIGMKQKWSLYNMLNPAKPAYNFPAARLVDLMKLTRNYSVLHHLSQQCGFVCYRYSSFRLGKKSGISKLAELFGHASAAIAQMYESHRISKEEYQSIYDLLREVAGHLKMADKIRSGQLEFNF